MLQTFWGILKLVVRCTAAGKCLRVTGQDQVPRVCRLNTMQFQANSALLAPSPVFVTISDRCLAAREARHFLHAAV